MIEFRPSDGNVDYSGEPNEESVEDVVEMLRRFDQELVKAQKVDPESPEDYLLRGFGEEPIEPGFLEQEALEFAAQEEIDEFTKVIRSTLNLVGIADPSSITSDSMKEIDEELIEQLDPYTAESLFFDVAQRVHSRLGQYEPVTWRRLVELAAPENRKVRDLDTLQLQQRMDALGFLVGLGVDADQLGEMIKSGSLGVSAPSRRQNVNRAAYLVGEEPVLIGMTNALHRHKKSIKTGWTRNRSGKKIKISFEKRERYKEPMPLEKLIRMAQIIMRFRQERLIRQKEAQTSLPFDNENVWDSVDHDVYRKIMSRLKASRSLSNLILAEMKITSADELLDTFEEPR